MASHSWGDWILWARSLVANCGLHTQCTIKRTICKTGPLNIYMLNYYNKSKICDPNTFYFYDPIQVWAYVFSLGLFFQRSVTQHIDKKWQKGDRLLGFLYVSLSCEAHWIKDRYNFTLWFCISAFGTVIWPCTATMAKIITFSINTKGPTSTFSLYESFRFK